MESLLVAEKIEYTETAKENSDPIARLPYNPKNNLGSFEFFDKKLKQRFLAQQYQQIKQALKKAETPRSLFEMAENFFVKGVYKKAEELYKKALARDLKLLAAYQRLILINLLQKKFDEAVAYSKLLVEASLRRADFLHNYILLRVSIYPTNSNVVDEALSDLQEIVKKEPDNALFFNSYGFVVLNLVKDVKRAIPYFKNAISINSNFTYALNNLGVCYLNEKKFDEANKYFDLAIKADAKFSLAYENASSGYILQKDILSALKPLEKAFDSDVKISDNWQHMYGWLLIQAGQFAKAKNWYLDRIKQEPANNLLFNNLGQCYLRLGDKSEAKNNFQKAAGIVKEKLRKKSPIDERSLIVFYNLARMAIDEGNSHKIKELHDDIIKINPTDAFALYLEGSLSLSRGKFNDAVNYYTKALEINQQLPEVYPDLSFIYECIFKDHRSAIKLLEHAIKIGLRFALIDNNLAYGYIIAGELSKAEKILKTYSKKPRPELTATQGLLAFRKGDIRQGDKFYELAISQVKPKLKPVATQIWRYEQALHWFNKKEFQKAKLALELAKEQGQTYMQPDIEKLEKDILAKV